MLGYFTVRQFGRLICATTINAKGRDTDWTGDPAGICIDYVLDGPCCEEDRFAQPRSCVRTKCVDQKAEKGICRKLTGSQGRIEMVFVEQTRLQLAFKHATMV